MAQQWTCIASFLMGFCLISGCSDAPPATNDASPTLAESEDGEQSEPSKSQSEEGNEGSDDSDSTTTIPKLSGQSLFEFSILNAFEAQCRTCHAEPRFAVENRGPLTIYNYLYMKPLVKDGTSVDNALLRKLLGVNHTGGNQCPEGLKGPPCSYVVDWYKAEFGDDGAVPKFIEDTDNADARPGHIAEITSLGKVLGWAVDKNDLSTSLTVKLYADGDASTGRLIATQIADREGFDGNHAGHHQFMVQLPDDLRDGKPHDLYLYATISDTDEQMAGPVSFTAYSYSQAGREYYNNTVLPLVAQCQACHSTTYEGHFANLISPTPAKGATADNNELINKASGRGHGGGARCATGSPCNEFRTWWELEFGDD